MNAGTSPFVGRLTLLVLTLILACLVVLVVRSFQDRPVTGVSAAAEAEVTSTEEPEPIVVVNSPLPLPRPPSRRVPTNAIRAVMVPPPATGADGSPSEESVAGQPGVADSASASKEMVVSPVSRIPEGGVAAGGLPVLTGIVTLSGMPPPEIQIEMDPACAKLQRQPRTTRHFVVSPEGGLANVFVYLNSAVPGRYVADGPPPLLDQVDCFFEPYVLGVTAGQQFQVRNSDPVLHNIHATPKANREFNFAQVARGQVNTRRLDVPELFVRFKCDVHPWMFAYVCVAPHPFHAVTDTNGVFLLPRGFPAGEYTVAAHHLRAGAAVQSVVLKPREQRMLHLQLAVPAGPRTAAR